MDKLSLCGAWEVHQVGKEETLAATVPGCVHTDLLAAGKIQDPFFGDNEDRLRWIGDVDWVYSRTFEVPAQMLAQDKVVLVCQGLDTLATVTVNGIEVGRSDNMFRVWEFEVKDALKEGENHLEVLFSSTMPVIEEGQKRFRLPGWGGPKEIRGRAWVRKEPCNYGWDWGPVLVTCGIWRPLEIVAFSEARLSDVAVRQDHGADGSVTLKVLMEAETVGQSTLQAKVTVSLEGQAVATTQAPLSDGKATAKLAVPDPQLWWPKGMGSQPLYEVKVTLENGEGKALDEWVRRIGLRTLRLDRHPDEWGESFQFVANGVPFFAKGANWIPADAFAARITDEHYRDLLQSTADANMNMLRVWGGGIYEQDVFYNLCDELGICIWQDFMFACSTYPTFDEAFMATVKVELEDNVRRLRHHPCIALWNGNNELEQGLVGDTWNDHQMSWEDYGKLFDKFLPELIARLDPDGNYWPSSPHSPHGDRKNHSNPRCGDAHLWDVWHGRKPFEWYRTCEHRFNSEFGFQSFPEPRTVYGYTEPKDRNVTTYVMEHHQRSGIGNAVIMQYMLDWFRLPTSFDMTLWLSQVLQGMAMKYAVEHWRRAMPRGMGTLYWQLNDCWPVASWASIDYFGRWKALHYMARRFNAPLLVSAFEDLQAGTVELHVTSDLREEAEATLKWWLVKVDGTVVEEGQMPVTAAPGANAKVTTLDLSSHLQTYGVRDLLLWVELESGGQTVSSNLVNFARPKHLELLDPKISAQVTESAPGVFAVKLETQAPALWVWLELAQADARYSDNFVTLLPGRPVTIEVHPQEKLTREQVEAQLKVRSLVDTYA
jgi:beta-mannosidase